VADVVNLFGPGREQREALLQDIRARKLVDEAVVARAQLISGRTGQPVEQVLNQLGALSDDDLASAYAKACGCEIWDPDRRPISVDPAQLGVSVDYLRRARLAPIEDDGASLTCAACDPLDREASSGLVFATGRRVTLIAARPSEWMRAFDLAFAEAGREEVTPDELRLEREVDQVSDGGAEGAGARLVAMAFEAAIASGASDIHFEPRRHHLLIRLRIDGRLVDHQVVSADLATPAVSRVKVMANLDLGERRLPQDGRTTFVIAGRQVDVRVATSPTVFGETAVLRILDRTSVPLDIDSLSLNPGVVGVLRRAARTPYGMFLVTGPTGSGKTTTLYALLQTFAGSAKKVLSVEDPVEFHFEHVSQTQVAPNVGLTFAKALRSFLRQDPDVILVGEIRDPETASVAVQAAMTGHLVLASVHANDALGVPQRLQDMGIEPFQLAAGFRGAAAQRLVRRLCPSCRRKRASSPAEAAYLARHGVRQPAKLFDPVGCAECRGQGFRGRVALAEAFFADEDFLRLVADRANRAEMMAPAEGLGLVTMAADGARKAAEGETTLDEAMAAVDV
jgi:type II secretory ATPase GspE/PulE/Tfp pilus assembly ATPase PilB-like protein